MLIYKILRSAEWADLVTRGETPGAPIDVADGFVHFSTGVQAAETAAKHFAGEEGLMLLTLDADTLGPALKWEPSRGGALFPHFYAPLRLADVIALAPLPWVDDTHLFPEDVTGHIDPTRAQFEAFKALDRDEPLEMLNLVALRDQAVYPADHPLADQGLTGAQAYANYGADTGPILKKVGGSILWRGTFRTTLIGPKDERWDHAFIARYPSAHAFLQMVTDPDYRIAVAHRQAAVKTSRLIRTAPSETRDTFG